MRAVLCTHFGPPAALTVAQIDPPVAGPDDLLVRVEAAALNFFDTLIIENKYQYKPDLPFSPGAEMAGVVQDVGSTVSGFEPGERVVGYLGYGCCRELVAAPAARFVKLPQDLEPVHAAGLIVTYGTTLHALQDRACLSEGETLVVLGAAGGVGHAAIEIGKIMGARVIAAASSEEKLDFCRSIGADETINYAREDLKEQIKALTGGKGADVIYDPVGGAFSEPALRATAWAGRYLVIGFAAGDIPKFPLNLVLLKGCQVVGVFWGSYIERDRAGFNTQLQQLMAWCLEGRIKPHVEKTYSLEQTADALQALAHRKIKGKAVITP